VLVHDEPPATWHRGLAPGAVGQVPHTRARATELSPF
jgi:hypothetical protein